MFKKLTNSEELEKEKIQEAKGGAFPAPWPWPTPIDDCFWPCLSVCDHDPIPGAAELNLAFGMVDPGT